MQVTRTCNVDPLGNCSDGTNMWDWNIDRLIWAIDTCWDKGIQDLAKKILKSNLDKINFVINKNQ